MNRLVLIGNGFDLAHDLKTSYKDFIKHLWWDIYKEIEKKAGDYFYDNIDYKFLDSHKLLEFGYTSITKGNLIGIDYGSEHCSANLIENNPDSKDFSESIKVFIKEISDINPKYLNNVSST